MKAPLIDRLRSVDHGSIEDCFLQSPLLAEAAEALAALEARALAAEAALAAEREHRKRLERRIHCQRVANRDNWMIVEQRGKSLRATAIHYISRGRALFDAGYNAGKAAAIRAQGE